MRAVVLHAQGDLRVEERADPEPGAGEVLIRIANGGICGSDLHYFRHGGFGEIRLREPMILGHEISGHVVALGEGVEGSAIGSLVAVNPSTPCGQCRFCTGGQPIHCENMRFLGSAMRMPHVQGGFAEFVVAKAANAVTMPDHVSPARAAFAEPLAVCLHAVGEAPVAGARVLVMGAGPIGMLTVVAARHAGAREIVVSDVLDQPLEFARGLGVDRVVNVATDPQALASDEAHKGQFDVVFEAAGQGGTIEAALKLVRPRGTIVLVGQGATATLPITMIVTKEIMLRGSFRFGREFEQAAALIGSNGIDVTPLLSASYPIDEAGDAFALACDKDKAMKVQLAFT